MADSTIPGLPVPTQERVTKWLGHGVVAALGVAAIIKFMPYINQALDLVANGVWSTVQLLLAVVAAGAAAYAIYLFWPVYKRIMESLANKATWAVLNYDPITPMKLWLQEVKKSFAELQQQYQNICAVIQQNEQTIKINLQNAAKAQRLFDAEASAHGPDTPQAHLLSIKPQSFTETAESIKQSTEQLYEIQAILKQVVDAADYTQQKAESDIEAVQQQYAAAIASEGALNSATKVLHSNTQRKQDAMSSMKIIHDKFAGNFGRLQGLQQLSQTIIANVGAEKTAAYQDTLAKFRSESRMITGGAATTAPAIDVQFTPVADAVPNGSFYKLPNSSDHSSR